MGRSIDLGRALTQNRQVHFLEIDCKALYRRVGFCKFLCQGILARLCNVTWQCFPYRDSIVETWFASFSTSTTSESIARLYAQQGNTG